MSGTILHLVIVMTLVVWLKRSSERKKFLHLDSLIEILGITAFVLLFHWIHSLF